MIGGIYKEKINMTQYLCIDWREYNIIVCIRPSQGVSWPLPHAAWIMVDIDVRSEKVKSSLPSMCIACAPVAIT